MSKIIIKWDDDIEFTRVINHVLTVIHNGRISNNEKQFCYASVFENLTVLADQTKTGTDVFDVRINK